MKYDLEKLKYFSELYAFRDYFELAEGKLAQAKQESAAKDFKNYDLTNEDDLNEYHGLKQIHDDIYEETIERLFRSSFIISLYSYIESWLSKLCKEVEAKSDNNQQLRLKDLCGDGLDKTARYLEIVKSIKLSSEPEWQSLKDLQLIRNCIVHADSVFCEMKRSGQSDKIWQLIQRKPSLGLWVDKQLGVLMSIDGESRFKDDFDECKKNAKLIILPDYCRYILKQVEVFFEKVIAYTKLK